MKQQKQKNDINNTLKQMMTQLQNRHEIRKQLMIIIIIIFQITAQDLQS
jgi:hypothetical protein